MSLTSCPENRHHLTLLRLIDPKGAVDEQGLYTDELYDFAKLSHSVLGGYDFIVNGLYDILLGEDGRLRLATPEPDVDAVSRTFISELTRRGKDARQIRLYEASLFLSMLPLHIDVTRNVLAFSLIAGHILTEVSTQ